MAAETAVLLFLTFFQLAGAILLAQRREGNGKAMRLLAALLVLNATLSAIRALEIEGGHNPLLDTTRALVDLPSALLIFAVVLALRPEERLQRAAIPVGAISLLHPVVALLAPPLLEDHYVLFFAIPYHVVVALLLWTASRSGTEGRWIALAFLPRALYFVTQTADYILTWGFPGGVDVLYQLVIGGLAIVCGAVLVRLLRDADAPSAPSMSIVVPALSIGPVIAIAQSFFHDPFPPGIVLLDLLTLAFARPILLYLGLLPGRLGSLLVNSVAAAGLGTLVVGASRNVLGFPAGAAALLGFALGVSVLAAADIFASGRRPAQAPPPAATADPSEGPADERPEDGGAPHWQRILLALQGSSQGAADGPAEPAWTQKDLSQRTGISVKRISEFPHHLNSGAEARLDAFVPEWRSECKSRVPTLVEVHRGAVRGLAGARVFYTLTPWGERLAAAVGARVAGGTPVGPTTTPVSESSPGLDRQNAARIGEG